MYNTYIPVRVVSPAYNRNNVLSELKRAGASRVFLAIGSLIYGSDKNDEALKILSDDIPFYKEAGLEVGVWLWGTMVRGNFPFTHITKFDGSEVPQNACPEDKDFVKYMCNFVRKIAMTDPDLIMLDDDMRYGFIANGFGCCCKNHMKLLCEELGEEIKLKEVFDKMFSGRPNKYRTTFLKLWGHSLENYCRELRYAVDSVNPEVRLGFCACISNFDTDGTDAFTMSKILAGNTKPFLRLIGAPYWGAFNSWSHRLCDVIEFERLERSWYKDTDIEIFSEGDTYPRPRYKVPSAYLELFDTALRASGGFDGILKYMLDYNSSTDYEREYITRHNANREMYAISDRCFCDKKAVGVRIYESMKKLENFDFTDRKHTADTIKEITFSRALRICAGNSIPTTHNGSGCCGLSFGENIRAIMNDKSIYEKPVIIDIAAARILYENGIDVGIEEFLGEMQVAREYFPDLNEYVSESPIVEKIRLDSKAKIKSVFIDDDGNETPAAYTYENKDGARFLIYNADVQLSGEEFIRNYARQLQLVRVLDDFGVSLPAYILGCPELYMLVKKDEAGNCAIGLWNCFADGVYDKDIILDDDYTNAETIGLDAELCGRKIRIGKLGAFEFGYIELSK